MHSGWVFFFFFKSWEIKQKPQKLALLKKLPDLRFTFRSFTFQQCMQAELCLDPMLSAQWLSEDLSEPASEVGF